MADPFRRLLASERDRAVCLRACEKAPLGMLCEIRDPTRSDDQNRLLWPLLTDIAQQRQWAGRTLPQHEWKNLMVTGLRSETCEFVPSLDFKSIMPLGLSTSAMGVKEFSDLLEFVMAWGAQNGVVFRTDKP